MSAINAKNREPGNTILLSIRVKYSSILSDLIPGMDPPFSRMFLDISIGFNVTCV